LHSKKNQFEELIIMFDPKPEFLARLPGQSLEGALEFLKGLLWLLSWKCKDGTWFVFSGDRLLFESDSEDAIWAFIYGLALAYRDLPKPLLTDFEEYTDAVRTGDTLEFVRRKGWRLS
jgi:hypothetical protein